MVEAIGEERLEALRCGVPKGESAGAGFVAVCVYRRGAGKSSGCRQSILRDENGFVLAGRTCGAMAKLPEGWQEQREPFLLESSVPGFLWPAMCAMDR